MTLERKTGLRRTPMRRRWTSTSPDAETVLRVWARDGGRCVPCAEWLRWEARGVQWSVSHRKLRAQGGDNRLSNLMLSCGNGTTGCEGDIHANPAKARDAGWMVRRDADPAEVELYCARRGRGRLTDDGEFVRTPGEPVPVSDVEVPDEHPF